MSSLESDHALFSSGHRTDTSSRLEGRRRLGPQPVADWASWPFRWCLRLAPLAIRVCDLLGANRAKPAGQLFVVRIVTQCKGGIAGQGGTKTVSDPCNKQRDQRVLTSVP